MSSVTKREWRFSRTRVLAMTCAILVLVLGSLVLWAPGGFLIEEDLGSGADWFGAAGTWVIGIAAVAYAHEERIQHRKQRQIELSDRERELRGRRQLMIAKAQMLRTPRRRFTRLFRRPVSKRLVGSIYGALDASEQAVRLVNWTDGERFLLDEEGVAALYDVEYRCIRFLHINAHFRDPEHNWAQPVQVRKLGYLVTVLKDIRELDRSIDRLLPHIKAMKLT